jgi:hypothetical protein
MTRRVGASNPQVRNRIRASLQVVKSAPRTLSRWRHGFKSRWDYKRETAGHGTSPESICSLNRDSNAGYPANIPHRIKRSESAKGRARRGWMHRPVVRGGRDSARPGDFLARLSLAATVTDRGTGRTGGPHVLRALGQGVYRGGTPRPRTRRLRGNRDGNGHSTNLVQPVSDALVVLPDDPRIPGARGVPANQPACLRRMRGIGGDSAAGGSLRVVPTQPCLRGTEFAR